MPGTWGLPPELLAAVMQGAAWLRGELAEAYRAEAANIKDAEQ
jgi:hypothetical protein